MRNKRLQNFITLRQRLFLGLMLCNITFLSNLFGQLNDCSKFKYGKFKLPNPELKNYIITRNDSIQTESDDSGTSTFKVKWIDNCSYNLIPTEETLNKIPDLPKNAIIYVKIIEVKENSYIYTTKSNFSDLVQKFEMIKIK
jgi:hypothetical protein